MESLDLYCYICNKNVTWHAEIMTDGDGNYYQAYVHKNNGHVLTEDKVLVDEATKFGNVTENYENSVKLGISLAKMAKSIYQSHLL